MSLEGKSALITGASGGIGDAIARHLHAKGAIVGLSGTRADALQKLADDLGDRAHILPCVLSDQAAVEQLIPQTIETLGGVDVLVNNAGITRDGLFMRMSDEDWTSVLEVNLTATFRLCRAVLRPMMKKRWGRIINISSIVGVTGNAGQGNYCASKAGMIGMSKALAAEVAPRNITVNCVAPGFIETPMTGVLKQDHKDALLKSIPAGKLGQPDDIAEAVGYLASAGAGYVTGQTLHVNGGMAMI